MTSTEHALCCILSSSLFGRAAPLPPDVDWDAVFREAKHQTVSGLAAQAEIVPENVRSQWEKYYYQEVANYTRNLYAQTQLIELFSNAGIPLVILKGAAAAVYYPVPFARSMGDIDFLVPEELFDASVELMKNNGYVVFHQEDDSLVRHIGFSRDSVLFELHRRFSHKDLDIEKYLVEGLKHTETGEIEGDVFPILPPLGNGLVLLDHMRSHLKSGLGLRQVIDWMMYADKVLNDTFWNSVFRPVAESHDLETLAITVTHMCQMYLGLSGQITWCSAADESLCCRLMDNLLSSGNFGRKQGTGNDLEKVGTYIRREGLFHYLQRAGEYNWKAYRKHKLLKPFCWAYQISRYIRQGIKTGRGRKLLKDVKRSGDRYELLKELKI